jgi:hypothetical protein
MNSHKTMEELISVPPLEPEITHVRSERELRAVSELDALAYGGESIDHEGLCAWWKAYPKGVFVLWKDSEIVGAVGVWPIKPATYKKIIQGKTDEVGINAKDICKGLAGRAYSYWYVADIVLREECRDQPEKWVLFLLEGAISQWLSEGNLSSEIHLCALGFKLDGISLLEKFKFLTAGDSPVRSPTGKPVYQRTVVIKDIEKVLEHISAARNEEKKYDVFISYRRKSAKGVAQLIQSELEKRNLRVCLDVTDFPQGDFHEAIDKIIADTRHFITILSHGCFRKRSSKDYFRRELALAIETKSKIIPIKMDDFEFPDASVLPAKLRGVLKQNSVSYSDEYPKAMIERIISFIRS